jgi:hypothetical protein
MNAMLAGAERIVRCSGYPLIPITNLLQDRLEKLVLKLLQVGGEEDHFPSHKESTVTPLLDRVIGLLLDQVA